MPRRDPTAAQPSLSPSTRSHTPAEAWNFRRGEEEEGEEGGRESQQRGRYIYAAYVRQTGSLRAVGEGRSHGAAPAADDQNPKLRTWVVGF